jgi:hypothetical protein
MIDVRARENSSARNGLRFLMRAMATLVVALFASSCGNGIFLVGTPVITLTAQRGHFLSYIVSIDEIELTRKDGTVIQLPIVSQRVDLANLGNFAQLLGAPALGIGTYVSATFFIDYSAAQVYVDNGGAALGATLTDASTAATPTVDTITVKFDPNNPLVISNQVSSTVNFNIDLDASNSINYAGATTTVPVVVHPMATVIANPTYTQPVFARGLFVYVNNNKGQFTFNSRPLHDINNSAVGAVTATPSATTYWNINGVTYTGADGLNALAKLLDQNGELQIAAVGPAPGSGVATWSDLSGDTPIFTPTQVYVGTSLESALQDHIVGWVSGISTSGGTSTLTVQNAALADRIGDLGFSNTATVTVGSSTIVSIDGVNPATPPSLSNISVGQLIDVSGQVTDATNTFNPTSLDATGGQVRLQPTSIWGTLVSGTTNSANIDLQWIQGLEVTSSNINFTGTGANGANATAANYEVSTATTTGGATDESTTAANTLLNIVGLANTFGAGPPYFNATTVTPATSLPQRLILEYTEAASSAGSTAPFSSISGTALVVNLADANLTASGTVHVAQVGPQKTDVVAAGTQNGYTTLQLIPATTGTVSFTVGNTTNGQTMFFDPTSFAAQVQSDLSSIGAVQKIVADGQYNPTAGTFTATNIEVVFQK